MTRKIYNYLCFTEKFVSKMPSKVKHAIQNYIAPTGMI